MALMIACAVLATPCPAPAAGPDLLHEKIGIDYGALVAGVEDAYATARARTVEAARILLPDEAGELAPDAADTAMALYEESVAIVRETESKYSQAYEKIPLLFVQLEYLVVTDLSGMAVIFSLRGKLDAAHDMRTKLIGVAEENQARIAFALERNILPQFHGQYLEIDDSFRQLLAESYVWMGVDAEAVGNIPEARNNYRMALGLSDNPESRKAIHVLLERMEFMHNRSVLTAGDEKAAPELTDPAAADGLPETPKAGNASDALPAGSDQ
jgi:tetratricopeptide (TPR) repeat protein